MKNSTYLSTTVSEQKDTYSNKILFYSINDLDRKGIVIHNSTPDNHNKKKLAV